MRRAPLNLLISTLLLPLQLASATPLGFSLPEGVDMASARLARIDALIDTAIRQQQTPGAVVLVAKDGKTVFRKAYGNMVAQPDTAPMKVNTIFDVASLTKVMATAPAIMLLVEQGKLSLSDNVAAFLPAFARHGKADITITHLLTHYSGLPPLLDLDKPWHGYAKAIDMAVNSKLQNPIGETFVYSDINYIILAELVRIISGKTIDEFTREHIFQPLGMTDTTFKPDITWQPRIAPTEKRDGQWLRGQVNDLTTYRMGGVSGQAGLFSTIDDIAVFAQMLLDNGRYQGIRVMHPATVKTMTANHAPPNAVYQRAMGFDINSPYASAGGDLWADDSFGHTGFTGTSLWINPSSKTLVILLTNRLHPEGKGDVKALRTRLANIVATSTVAH